VETNDLAVGRHATVVNHHLSKPADLAGRDPALGKLGPLAVDTVDGIIG
jgi:hypothetical protein